MQTPSSGLGQGPSQFRNEIGMGSTRNVLVTGAGGFVGKFLVPRLRESGWRVFRSSRRNGYSHETKNNDEFFLGDLENYRDDVDLSGFHAVVHLAALVHQSDLHAPSASEYLSLNCDATAALGESALKSGVSHFIFLSTVKVFGESSKQKDAFLLDDPLNPQDPYAQSKACAESVLTDLFAGSATKLTIVRSPLVYGPNAKANVEKIVKLALTPMPLPFRNKTNRRSIISVQNLADLITHIVDQSESSSTQVVLAHEYPPVSTGEMVETIRTSTGHHARLFAIPSFLLSLLRNSPLANGLIGRLFGSLVVDQNLESSLGWSPAIETLSAWESTTCANRHGGKILFLVTEDWYFLSHRKSLALAAQRDGWEVHVACIVNDKEDEIRSMGFQLHALDWQRIGSNLASEVAALRQIIHTYRTVRPQIAHHVALKPILFGGIAAKIARTSNVLSAFTGLGSAYDERGTSWRAKFKRSALNISFRSIIRGNNQWVVLQNRDDFAYISRLLKVDESRIILIPGSGLDSREFDLSEREDRSTVSVVMASRMIYAKGVEEFVTVAQLLGGKYPEARFRLAGGPDIGSADAISLDKLVQWDKLEGLEWLGYVPNMKRLWVTTDIAVLPSRYREGIPRSLLEAAASGCALVAYDVPGCRDLIEHRVTGLLADPTSPNSLSDAISYLIENPTLRRQLGHAARERVLKKFSDDIVLQAFLAIYNQCGKNPAPIPCPVSESWMCCHQGRPFRNLEE